MKPSEPAVGPYVSCANQSLLPPFAMHAPTSSFSSAGRGTTLWPLFLTTTSLITTVVPSGTVRIKAPSNVSDSSSMSVPYDNVCTHIRASLVSARGDEI